MLNFYKFIILAVGIIVSSAVEPTDNYECQEGSLCVPYEQCQLSGYSYKTCDTYSSSYTTNVCCPRSSISYRPPVQTDVTYEGDYTINHVDYYEAGYKGHKISHEAQNLLKSYDYFEECGVRKSFQGKVSTGYEADLGLTKFGEFPWQVALLVRVDSMHARYGYNRAFRFLCGATVVHPMLLLTAAHCVKGIRTEKLKANLGEWNLQGSKGEMFPPIERTIQKIILHEYYSSVTFAHDIALLVLNKPVDLKRTPHVAPVCLLPSHYKFEEYKKCFIVGWGDDIYKPNYGSNILKFASVSLLKQDCKVKLKASIPSLSNSYFEKDDVRCIIGAHGKDACVGDGGGAVVCPLSNHEAHVCKGGYSCQAEHYFIAGIISFGSDKCGTDNSVTIVTDIHSHINWIQDKIRPYGEVTYYNYKHHGHDYHGDYQGNSYKPTGYGYNGKYEHSHRYEYDNSDTYGHKFDYGSKYYDDQSTYDVKHSYGVPTYDANYGYPDTAYDTPKYGYNTPAYESHGYSTTPAYDTKHNYDTAYDTKRVY